MGEGLAEAAEVHVKANAVERKIKSFNRNRRCIISGMLQ